MKVPKTTGICIFGIRAASGGVTLPKWTTSERVGREQGYGRGGMGFRAGPGAECGAYSHAFGRGGSSRGGLD